MSGYKKNSLYRRERGKQPLSAGQFFYSIIFHLPRSVFFHFYLCVCVASILINGGENFVTICGNAWGNTNNCGVGFWNFKIFYFMSHRYFFALLTAGYLFVSECVFFDCCTCVIKLFYFNARVFCSVCQLLLICCVSKSRYFTERFPPKFSAYMINYFHFVTISHIHDGRGIFIPREVRAVFRQLFYSSKKKKQK